MKVIINNWIPFKGFKAINLFSLVFAREDLDKQTLRHEQIHTYQMKEMLYVFFYIWYGVEWLVRKLFMKGNPYKNMGFEKEAYKHQDDLGYKKARKHFKWFKYINNSSF